MAKISGKETKPEIIVRKALFNEGFRYRKNVSYLPGKPDIVLRKYNTVIFVNGCFWHLHQNCSKSTLPKANSLFWKKKIENNVARDTKNLKALRQDGWKIFVIWECQLSNSKNKKNTIDRLINKIRGHSSNSFSI
jgi:DNA mismatch endonuclease, patch repair protein